MKIKRALAVLSVTIGAFAAAASGTAQQKSGFVRITPEDLRWQTVPDSPGVQQALLLGDPTKSGMYVVRVKFPPYTMDVPHWHPNARYVTVLEGTWYTGTGDSFDPDHAVPLKPGSVMLHPAKSVHWDGSRGNESVIVQIIGEGPGTTTQVESSKPFWVQVPH